MNWQMEVDFVPAEMVTGQSQPGNMLAGARCKEDLTQQQLSKITGIPQHQISEIENGKRPIGKQRAKLLGEALNINYRVFL